MTLLFESPMPFSTISDEGGGGCENLFGGCGGRLDGGRRRCNGHGDGSPCHPDHSWMF